LQSRAFLFYVLRQVKRTSAIVIFKMAVAAVPCISVLCFAISQMKQRYRYFQNGCSYCPAHFRFMFCDTSNELALSLFSKWL
jgi:hypothetical protein